MATGDREVTGVRAPFVMRWLLRLLAPPGEADALLSDLEHEANQIAAASGARAARRWMRWQAAHSVWPLAKQQWRMARRGGGAGMSVGGSWIDLRHAARRLRRTPGFVAVAVLTLAAGIGTASAIFSLAYAIWLKPLPYRDADRLVMIQTAHAKSGDASMDIAGPEIADYREGAASVANSAAFGYAAEIARIGDERVRIQADHATPNLFEVLGARPVLGRTFSASDVGQPVVVLSYATWVSRFGKDPNVLSRTFELSERPYSIIGVMPPGFRFPQILESDIWTASDFASWTDRSQRYLQLVARLPAGVTLDQASGEVAAVSARLARAYPATNDGWSSRVVPLDDRRAAGYGAIFGSLLGIVGLFLFVGCANLAGLLVVRNIERRGELAVCASLGATRLRLARQLGFEAGVIALAGSLVGMAIASPAGRVLASVMPPRLPGLADVQLSWPVLAFAVALSVVTALLCGVLPALSLGTVSASEALIGARRSGPRSQRLQSALVVAEVTTAMILVVGATLMTQSFTALLNRDRGFNPHGMFALNVSLPFEQDKYLDSALRAATLDEIVSRVAKLPGVTHAGATNGFPGSALGILGTAMLHSSSGARDVSAALRSASPDYFAAMGVAIRSGRAFRADDTASSPRVAVVNETLARAMWPDGTAIGRVLPIPSGDDRGTTYDWTVVGVAADMHLGARSPADIFLPVAQRPAFWIDLVMRTNGDPDALAEPVRRTLREINRDLLIENSRSIDTIVSNSLGLQRAQASLATVVGTLSTAVAGVGLYALLAFAVAQRKREFGIRLALGSAPRALSRWMFVRGLRLAIVGVAAGSAITFGLVRLLRAQVFGLSSATPWAYALAALALLVVAALALWAPARRVLRTDPIIAMRVE
ncbi:MAG TPA: ABC transporter permease [Vicinamibacterales bacterium]|nr:ABC transporter permease [Vicinamibacterales bacterium]